MRNITQAHPLATPSTEMVASQQTIYPKRVWHFNLCISCRLFVDILMKMRIMGLTKSEQLGIHG